MVDNVNKGCYNETDMNCDGIEIRQIKDGV